MMHANFAKMLQLVRKHFGLTQDFFWVSNCIFALYDPKIRQIATFIILISGKPASLPSTLQIPLELNWLTSMMTLKLLSI